MSLSTRALSDNIGVEITDFNISTENTRGRAEEVAKLLDQHGVVLLRNQKISEDQHIAFSRFFGDLEIHVLKEFLLPGHPEILLISNIEDNGKPIGVKDAGQYWHSDLSYKSRPSRCSLLLAREIPESNGDRTFGDTCFVSTSAAYKALSHSEKEKLDGLSALHHYQARYEKLKADNTHRKALSQDQIDSVPPVLHPVIRTHPFTGEKCIYVNEGFTQSIDGLSSADSENILNKLYAHCQKPEFMYRHKWQTGDLLIWDNCSTQHLAIADYKLPQRRLMHRTTVAGSEVF